MTVVRPPVGGLPPPDSNKNRLSKNARERLREPQYLPAVYRYSCQGAFSVSTDTPGSVGTCRGIRSNIEHLMDMNVSSRQEAVRNFQNDFMMMDPSSDDKGRSSENGDSFDEAVQLLDGRQPNPALVYRKNKQQKEEELRERALARHREKEQQELEQKQKRQKSSETETTPSKELTKGLVQKTEMADSEDDDELYDPKFIREAWSAYGSTEVECLQLTNMKDGSTEIVAVAPYNHALVSYRRLEFDEKRAFSWQIGFHQKFMFTIEDHHGTLDEEEAQEKSPEQNGIANQKPQSTSTAIGNDTKSPSSSSDGNGPSSRGEKDTAPGELPQPEIDITNSGGGNRIWDSLTNSYQFGIKTAAFSARILQSMDNNSQWLYANLKDDFAARTIASGKRIAGYMPKTAVVMTKAVKQLLGIDNDPNGGDGGLGGGGGASPA
mmetsp:Transcript_36752/g.76527  ORF Transcript_36752/g.76527 Transcript_36752/m.76527 type:complete len:436 (-) Transcript_36752:70-1377(-)